MVNAFKGANEYNMNLNWKRVLFLFMGIFLFALVFYAPPWPDAIDPKGIGFLDIVIDSLLRA